MTMKSLAIEGAGLISSLGIGVESNFAQLLAGISGIKDLQYFATNNFNARRAYEISAPPGESPVLRATGLVCAAIGQAVAQAGLSHEQLRQTPIIIGTGLRELRSVEQWYCDQRSLQPQRLDFSMAVRESLGVDVPCYTLSNACAASLYALGVAEDLLRLGLARRVIVAGCDVLTESMHGLLDRVQLSTPQAVQPFAVERKGVLMGDGAAALVLATPENTRTPLAWLESVGLNCDAYHETAPSLAGIAEAIRIAHRRAGIGPGEIDLIYMHGTGTFLNDTVEAGAVSEVFCPELRTADKRLPVTAIKAMTGHTSGASGLSSLVAAVRSLHTGEAPGTPGETELIPELSPPLHLLRTSSKGSFGRIQINAFGFGGVNAVALVTDRPSRDGGPMAADYPVAITGISPLFTEKDKLPECALLARLNCQAADPMAMLGRKGLRQKDRATQLALCAALGALPDAGLPCDAANQLEPEALAVVVSSNTGNIDTVCRVSGQIREGGVANASPLDLPNASSNIIASAIAIRIGARQANLMVCNGASSGLDALYLARNLIAAGRATRVLVVGVEVDNDYTRALFTTSAGSDECAPFEAAIAVVLEREEVARARGRTPYARLGGYRQSGPDDADLHRQLVHSNQDGQSPIWWMTPEMAPLFGNEQSSRRLMAQAVGRYYGALGVIQAAAVAVQVARDERATLVSCGGEQGSSLASLALQPTW